jgi:hypothetical protein
MKSTLASFTCLILLTLTGLCFNRKEKVPRQSLVLNFHHTIGGNDLVLGNTYKNVWGENIVIRKFKYYLSNFALTDTKGKITKLPVQYFLVDQADPSSQTIVVKIPKAPFSSIRFLLGVDSIKNVSGVQTGALDPLKGMFWTWNSGYIMAKLEGSSEVSTSPGHSFTYHVGGFKRPSNTVRIIELSILQKDKPVREINIRAEINQWFKSSYEIKTTETPVCHDPGALAMKIADNYSTMFTINSVR